jgi:hypothetical protein
LERVVVRAKQNDITTDELRNLLADDYAGHTLDVGEIDKQMLTDFLLDREKLFSGTIPKKGRGYEIVEHQASAIVGSVNN